ncbi:MAG: zinc-dependent peptidase, partial [Ilumatobacteraceae bacterium]
MPADAELLFDRHLCDWRYFDVADREQFVAGVEQLLAQKRWEAASGFDLTDAMCTVIAAQVALMSLGIGLDVFDEVQSIVVHPTTMTSVIPRPGPVSGVLTDEPVHLLGEAHHFGPVLLAWDAVRSETRRWGHGYNVVIHEFAHKL